MILKKYYGYSSFRKGQEKIIQSILEGCDTFTIMPTGAGKSLCFQIPALIFSGVTLVISPLISLMKDQVDALESLGIAATFINSSLDFREVEERITKTREGKFKILYVAPERLEAKSFKALVKSLYISLLVIDEAHCVSQWGHDFRPSYRLIAPFLNELLQRPVIAAFTATATEEVKEDIVNLLDLKAAKIYVTGFNRENLSFAVIRGENKREFALKYLTDHRNQAGIIYAATRKEVDSLYELLSIKGFLVGKYHAGLSDAERIESQESFLYDDLRVMVATNAFGMGIDKSNVRYVIHYNMPKNIEAYYQEAGRAGRDGEPGECILLFGAQDIILQKYLIEQTTLAPERKANEYRKLQTMVDYCHTQKCLREFILEYFGDDLENFQCGNCGNCNDEREMTDITTVAQTIFSCILRLRERYGVSLVAEVLKGSKTKKIYQLKLESLPTYGLMKDHSLEEIKNLVNLLIAEEYLALTEGEYPVVKVRPKAISVVKNEARVFQKALPKTAQPIADDTLFERLRALRKEISQRERVPPYIIFADSTLRQMCEDCPPDMRSMLRVKGVGEAKFAKYGAQFLKIINEYLANRSLAGPAQNAPSFAAASQEEKKTPSHEITYHLFQTGLSLKEIAKQRELTLTTIEDHLIRCGLEGYKLDWNCLIPEAYEALILAKVKELGAEKLRPLKDALPDEVDYAAIKAVVAKYFQMESGARSQGTGV